MPKHSKLAGCVVLAALAVVSWGPAGAPGEAAAASIKRYVNVCDKGLCPWFLAEVTPPKGWVILEEESQESKVRMLLPEGEPDPAKALIYIKARHDPNNDDIVAYAARSQTLWMEHVPDSTIERLEDHERKGKPPLIVYLYKNPSHAEQAFELTAFVRDADDENPKEHYIFQAVLTGPTMKSIEDAKQAFFETLESL